MPTNQNPSGRPDFDPHGVAATCPVAGFFMLFGGCDRGRRDCADMAGDWIKIQHVTPDKPEVWQMAASLGIDADAVVGKLVRVWVWADQQSVDGTCHAASVTKALLDRMVSVAGFCDCMVAAGWMLESDDGITFTNFDRHNGTSAKKRAQANDRQTASRKRNADVTQGALQKRDQRREEKKYIYVQSPDVLIPTTMDNDTCKDAMVRWCKYMEAKGWHESAPSENEMQLQAAWEMAARMGPDGFPAAVQYSIANGWKNLRVPNEGTAGARRKKPHNQKPWQMVVAICLQHAATTPEDSKTRKEKLGDNFDAFRQAGGFARFKAANDMQRQAMAAEFIAILEARDGQQVAK